MLWILCLWVQMRGSCDPVGYRMAHGWRYTNPSLASAVLGVYYRHASDLLYGLSLRVSLSYLSLSFRAVAFFTIFVFPFISVVFALFLLLCSGWSFVDRCFFDLFLSNRPRILLGMVEARSVNVKNIHTHTHTSTPCDGNTVCLGTGTPKSQAFGQYR